MHRAYVELMHRRHAKIERERQEALDAAQHARDAAAAKHRWSCHVRLQRWARRRMGWKSWYQKCHPEWIVRREYRRQRKRLFVMRMVTAVGGHCVIVTVFRSHYDDTKDRKYVIECYRPETSRTYLIRVHESQLVDIVSCVRKADHGSPMTVT